MAAQSEDEQIRTYVERLAAFEVDGDAPLDADALREIASQVGVSDAAIERAEAAALRHRVEGAKALRAGDLAAAVRALNQAIELAPADPVAMSLLGDALRQRWHDATGLEQAATEREAARRVLLRAQALHWTPENDAALAELDGPQRPRSRMPAASTSLPAAASATQALGATATGRQTPGTTSSPLARPTRRSGLILAVAAVVGLLAALAFGLIATRDAPSPDAGDRAAPSTWSLPSTTPAPPSPGAATPPSSEVVEQLPWTLDAKGLDGLEIDGGGVVKRAFRFVPASFRLDVWLRWRGADALTGLSVSFELLNPQGEVVQATNGNVIQDFHPPVRPGDLLPVHVQPMIVHDEQLISSARLRVVASQHAPLEALAAPTDVPITWVVRSPEGVKLRATVRAEHRSEFGSGANRMRSQQVDIELRNEGSVTITELQTAQRYLDAKGEVVHQGDNDSAVPSYLPPLRPGDTRVFRAYESSLPAWSRFELAVQAVKVAPP